MLIVLDLGIGCHVVMPHVVRFPHDMSYVWGCRWGMKLCCFLPALQGLVCSLWREEIVQDMSHECVVNRGGVCAGAGNE